MRPPEHLLKQLSVYTEEKFEDEEDLRERSFSHAQESKPSQHSTESQGLYQDLMLLARRDEAVDSLIVDILKQLIRFLERNNGDWCVFLETRYTASITTAKFARDHIGTFLKILGKLVCSADGLRDL